MMLTNFIHQKSYERINYQLRRHPITAVPTLVLFLFLLAVPPIVFPLVSWVIPPIASGLGPMIVYVLLGSIFYLSVGLFAYTYFVNYFLDLLIITNDRLMHIDQEGVFARTISEVDLYKIQDITSTIDGFFPSLFNYGDLLVQTAGTVDKFQIIKIRDPENMRQKIMDLAEEDRKHHATDSTSAVK